MPFDEPYSTAKSCTISDSDFNTDFGNCQEFSEKNELKEKFAPKRELSEKLSASFSRLEMDKRSERVAECGTFLEFAHQIADNGDIAEKGKLFLANFCRDRLCPMCAWRRSYKIFGQISQIMQYIGKEYDFLFLTLTIPNINASELPNTLKELQQGWNKLKHRKRFRTAVKGYFKALEITYNKRSDTYHPHYHIVLAVQKSYFTSRDYIKQQEWLQMWRECMSDERITQVDIRRAKNKATAEAEQASADLSSAIAEIAKYAVKLDEDMLYNDEVVRVLATCLHGKRLCEFDGKGAFGSARSKLQLDDAEDGDLVNIGDDKIEPNLALLIVRYGWSAGVYQMKDCYIKNRE